MLLGQITTMKNHNEFARSMSLESEYEKHLGNHSYMLDRGLKVRDVIPPILEQAKHRYVKYMTGVA